MVIFGKSYIIQRSCRMLNELLNSPCTLWIARHTCVTFSPIPADTAEAVWSAGPLNQRRPVLIRLMAGCREWVMGCLCVNVRSTPVVPQRAVDLAALPKSAALGHNATLRCLPRLRKSPFAIYNCFRNSRSVLLTSLARSC
jgi:hypothetical protein